MSGVSFDLDTAALATRLRQAPKPVVPVAPTSESSTTAPGMIFLRRNVEQGNRYWILTLTGIRNVVASDLPLGLPGDATLRDALAYLGKAYGGKLAGAWLLVAP